MTLLDPVRSPPVSARALAAIAAGLGKTPPAHLLGGQPERRWSLITRHATYEAWIIAWPPGTGLDLHDHDGSMAGVHVSVGRLRERYVGADGELYERWWNRDDRHELPADHVHEVRNVGTVEAVTIHVYSPRLREVRFRTERSWTADGRDDAVGTPPPGASARVRAMLSR